MERNRISRLVLATALTFAPAGLAGLALSAWAPSAHAADKADDKEGKKKEGKETELQKHMEVIEAAMKKLRRSLPKADQNEESLKQIAEIKKAAAACKDLIPAMASTIPAGERDKFVANYKKDMDGFVASVDKMEAAVKAGKNDDAVDIHKKLKELEDEGHEKYNK